MSSETLVDIFKEKISKPGQSNEDSPNPSVRLIT